MRILDRAIIVRFLWNFALLFALLFIFAISVDVLLAMDKFAEAASVLVKSGQRSSQVTAIAWLVWDFHGPRVFQFFQFTAGLLCIGAMGFTFSQMHRTRELTAIMAAGVPLRRCVWAVLVAAGALNLVQLVNQELLLPSVAERLMREHSDLTKAEGSAFTVPLTVDSARNLLYAERFDPETGAITGLLAVERDPQGSLVRRITAAGATYDAAKGAWILRDGMALRRDPAAREDAGLRSQAAPIAEWPTDLSPRALSARHYRLFAQMLSSGELRSLAEAGAIERSQADRMQLGRAGAILVNLLALLVAVPFFLQRGPANMLRETVLCAGTCLPAYIVSIVLMSAPIPGLPAAVSVALPIALLAPAAVARIAWLRS
ncbi:MAG: LptF/LptG family permease [Phycisphaerales bacterium]